MYSIMFHSIKKSKAMSNFETLATIQTDDIILLFLVVIVAMIIRDDIKNKGLRRW